MDGIHDMGGMHGFGPVVVERDEPVFHEPWEGRVFGLMMVTGAKRLRSGPLRGQIEALPATTYLESSYYERWLHATEAALVDAGTVSHAEVDELATRSATPTGVNVDTDAAFAAELVADLTRPNDALPARPPARYAAGERVTVRRMAPARHTRCPRYIRGARGTVTAVLGGWPVPDAGYRGNAETVYTVAFAMADLWGADAEPGELRIDLWERYLE